MRRLDHPVPRAARRACPGSSGCPSEHIRDNVRFATQPVDRGRPEASWSTLIELMRHRGRMFMFATDYPHFDADSADVRAAASLPEALRQRIRYENALDTYPHQGMLGI